jgi:N-acetylneuraminic acid mutarotase
LKKLGWFVGLLVVSACSFRRPPALVLDGSAGGDSPLEDAGADSSTCQLTAIGPSLANTDDPFTMEGTFVDPVTVNFPGATPIAATLLGPHRARVRVPVAATAGDLTVSTCGLTLGPLPFRRASFTLGVGAFMTGFEQSAGARQYQNLSTPRANHTSMVIGGHIYVLGGVDRGGSLNNVERALINADGSFGKFAAIPGVTLVTPRQAHTTALIGNQLYVIGGFSDGSLSSIEHATVAQDGSLSSFTTVTGVTLATARQNHTIAVIGNYLYVIGGLSTSTLNTIERATIRGDGTLGTFAILPDVALSTPRRGHTTVVVDDYLYVIGGTGSNGVLKDTERAMINADGSLGPFGAAPTALVFARSGHAAAAIGNHVYVFGGVGESGSVNTTERASLNADGSLGAFEVVASATMQASRHGHTLAIAGNHLYILGGSDDIRFLDFGERATLNTSGEIGPFGLIPDIALTSERAHCAAAVFGNYLYVLGGVSDPTGVERASVNPDGSIGPFAPVPDVSMAQPHDGHTTAVIGNYLYVLGGGGTSIERTTISADGSLAAFETLTVPMMGTHQGAASAVIDGYLYVFGGSGSGDSSTSVEQAVINSDSSLGKFIYSTGDSVTARTFPAISTIAGSVYLFGGSDPGGFAAGAYRAQIESNGTLDAFEVEPSITLDAHEPMAASIGGYMYAFGIDGVIQRSSIATQSSPGLSAFMTVPNVKLTTNRFAGVSAVLGNYVYVAAGAAGRNPLNTVERAELR